MSSSAAFRRNPLIINGNSLTSGERSATFTAESPRALLRSYLIFVRDMRGQRREPSIELRTDDVMVLAHHLGVTEEFVLGGLLDLMGATRAQRSTMLAMLAAGALTIVLTGSIVSDLSTDGISVDMTRLADAVQAAATGSGAEASSSDVAALRTATVANSPDPATSASSASAAATPAVAPSTATASAAADSPAVNREAIESAGTATATAAAAATTADRLLAELTLTTPRPDVLQSAAASSAAAFAASQQTEPAESAGGQSSAEQVGAVAQEPMSIGIAPDGSLVASVAPPVPAATPDEPIATAELPDGTVVGVAAPPVPPATPATPDEPIATAELPDGTVVGVAAPPVPPPSND